MCCSLLLLFETHSSLHINHCALKPRWRHSPWPQKQFSESQQWHRRTECAPHTLFVNVWARACVPGCVLKVLSQSSEWSHRYIFELILQILSSGNNPQRWSQCVSRVWPANPRILPDSQPQSTLEFFSFSTQTAGPNFSYNLSLSHLSWWGGKRVSD